MLSSFFLCLHFACREIGVLDLPRAIAVPLVVFRYFNNKVRRAANEIRGHHNLKAAKELGLTIPPNVLGGADKVVK